MSMRRRGRSVSFQLPHDAVGGHWTAARGKLALACCVLTQNSQYNSIVIPGKLTQLARPGIEKFQKRLDTDVRRYDE
jgi:hypothetical protein